MRGVDSPTTGKLTKLLVDDLMARARYQKPHRKRVLLVHPRYSDIVVICQ